MRELRHCFAGQWTAGEPLDLGEVCSPTTGELVARFPIGSTADATAAVTAATAAAPGWAGLAPAERTRLLADAGERLSGQIGELIRLEALEMGKPVSAAREWTLGAPDALKAMGVAAEDFFSRPLDAAGSRQLRVPYGVTGLIVPWNFPVMMALGQLAGLLAAGNTVVYKPSEKSPLSAVALVEALDLPPGVVNLLLGDARTGAALVEDPRVGMVSFTGSVPAGRAVGAASGRLLRPVLLELGGKDPVVVDADVDPVWAAGLVASAALLNTGQICVSPERVYVHRAIAEPFLDALVAAAESQVVGDPQDPATTMGPLVDEAQRAVVARHVAEAVKGGARVLTGGVTPPGPGTFYPATVLVDVDEDMAVMTEETFGPVIPVQIVATFTEGLERAGDSTYGLAATVLTHDPDHIAQAGRLPVGIVWVNAWQAYTDGMVYEPAKASGVGRTGDGTHYLAAATQARTIVVTAPEPIT